MTTMIERIARAIYAAYVADDNRQSDEAEIIRYKHEPFEKLDNVELRLLNDQAEAALEALCEGLREDGHFIAATLLERINDEAAIAER